MLKKVDVGWWHGYETISVADPPRRPEQPELQRLSDWILSEKPLTYVPIPFDDFLWLAPLRHYPHERWNLVAAVQDFTGKRVADVGANLGYYGWLAAASGAQKVTFIEPSPKANHVLTELIRMYGYEENVATRSAPFETFYARDLKRFDVVIAFSVLPYSGKPDPEKLKNLLSRMATNVPVSYIEMGDGGSGLDWCQGDAAFAQLFRDAGFDPVEALGSVFSTHTGTQRTIWRCGGAHAS